MTRFMILLKSLGRVLWQEDIRLLEVFCGFISIGIGGWLLAPWDTFAVTIVFDVMSSIASEDLWGIVFVLSGLGQIIGALTNGTSLHRYAVFLSVILWLTITATAALSNFPSTATPVFFVVVLGNMLSYIRIPSRGKDGVDT